MPIAALLLTLVALQDASAPLLARLDSAPRAAAMRTVRADPDAARRALDALIARADASVHSDRDHPEQRRVVYDRDALALGLRTGRLVAAATGDRSYARRFAARQQRLAGTEQLNARRYRQALATLGAALGEAQALRDGWLEVITRINIAYARLQIGQGALALEHCQRAADLAARLDDRARALTSFNLGSMHLHLAHARESITYSRQAATLSRRVGIKLWEGNSLLNIGAAQVQLGDVVAAHDAFAQALQVLQHTTDQLGTGRAWYNLGLVAMQQNQPAEAARCMERALPIIRSVDIRHSHDIELDRAVYQNPIELSALDVLVRAYGAVGDTAKQAAAAADLQRVTAARPAPAAPHRHGGGR